MTYKVHYAAINGEDGGYYEIDATGEVQGSGKFATIGEARQAWQNYVTKYGHADAEFEIVAIRDADEDEDLEYLN